MRALVGVVVLLVACTHSESKTTPPTTASVQQAPPKFLANIPADTPVVLLSLEALPRETLTTMLDLVVPSFGRRLKQKTTDQAAIAFFAAIGDEVGARPTLADLEKRGLSARARFAMFLLDTVWVFRLEIRDPASLLAAVQRVATTLGKTLPPPIQRMGRSYWRIDRTVALAFDGNELVFAGSNDGDAIDANLDLVLGIRKPEHSYADGKELATIMGRHHLGPHLVGIVDVQRWMDATVARAKPRPSPACAAQLGELAKVAPRVVLGHNQVGRYRFSGGLLVELSAQAVADVRGLRASVPGLDVALRAPAVMAFGGGVDLAAAHALAQRSVAALGTLATVCESPKMTAGLAELGRTVTTWIPPPFDSISGFGVVVHDLALVPGEKKFERLEGLAFVTAANSPQLYKVLLMVMPRLASFGVQADGGIHALPAGTSRFDLFGGVGANMLIAAVGARDGVLAKRVIAEPTGAASPFLTMRYDYRRLVEMQKALNLLEEGDPYEIELAKVWGQSTFTFDVDDDGLRLWSTVELAH